MQSQILMLYALNIFTLFWIYAHAIDYVFIFDRVENIKGDKEDLLDFTALKIIRKASNYFINGTYTLRDEFDNSFSVDLTTAYSPLGDSRFIKQPFQLKKRPVCCFYNTTYKNHMEPSFIKGSDFPKIPPEGLCPLPKGTFYIKEVSLVDDNLPSHLGRGLWRLEERLYKGNECVGGVRVFVHIKDKH